MSNKFIITTVTEKLAAEAGSSKGLVFVPAFSGLYAPHWRPDARGTMCGITQFHNKTHIAYAALEAVCFQTREVTVFCDIIFTEN